MDEYMIILRIIHGFAGVYWLGASIFLVGILEPTAESAGETGQRFLRILYLQRQFVYAFPAVAVLSTLSGLLMYENVSSGFDSDFMSGKYGVVLSVGVLAGIAGFIFGGAVHGRLASKMGELIQAIQADENGGTPEQIAELKALQGREKQAGFVSVGLLSLALTCMMSARYMFG
jgi:uncharacterized membrane protein